MQEHMIEGALTALVTPMNSDGSINFADLESLVENQIKAGIDGLIPMGTTGESPTLKEKDHLRVIEVVTKVAAKRVPVYAGTGANSTEEALELTAKAEKLGIDGTLQVTPYYNKPSQEGLFQHFKTIANASELPIILYSIPSRSVIEIAVDTVKRLVEVCPNIRTIKEAGGQTDRVSQLNHEIGSELSIISGDDALTLPFISVGARGVISVASNIIPAEVTEMVHLARNNDIKAARKLHFKLYPLFKGLFDESSPSPIKYALHKAGMISSPALRLPLVTCSEGCGRKLDKILKELELI